MTATRWSDLFIAACYGVWLFAVAMGNVWRDARQQMEASL